MTKEEAIARAKAKGGDFKAYLNKRSTHRTQLVPRKDEPGVYERKEVKIEGAQPEYLVARVKLAHYIEVAVTVFMAALTLYDLIAGSGGGVALAALTGTGLYDNYLNSLIDPSIQADYPVDWNTNTIRLQGLSATGETAGDATVDVDMADAPYASGNRTHGPTTLSASVSEPVTSTFRADATDLSGTFTDPNNGNGATSTLLTFKDGAADANRVLVWYSVLASDVAQDGTDDDVTFNASGLFEIS